MKIALISYEYPPDTANGGIATYVHQVAIALLSKGHYVEVFAGSDYRQSSETEDGVLIHRVNEKKPSFFSKHIANFFLERHSIVQFDVIEGPEYAADTREIVRLVPDIPLVIKLHTPSFLIRKISTVEKLSTYEPSFSRKMYMRVREIRQDLRKLLRGNNSFWRYDPSNDLECLHTLEADEIVAPSQAIAKQLITDWQLDSAKVSIVPNPYIPSTELLNIPIDTHTNVVTFIGRLEVRKGVLDLAKAIPWILRHHPDAKFVFIGNALSSPNPHLNMQQFLEYMLRDFSERITFTGNIPYSSIPMFLENTDVCVFPSIWENFPNVCLEAMAAGRGVVGSSTGGFSEMLDFGNAGKIVQPKAPKKLAKAIVDLLRNPTLRMKLGEVARSRILTQYNADRIVGLQEASYQRAIQQRKALGSRSF